MSNYQQYPYGQNNPQQPYPTNVTGNDANFGGDWQRQGNQPPAGGQPPAPPKKKQRPWVGWVAGGIGGLILGLVMGSAGGSSTPDAKTVAGPTVTVTAPNTASSSAPAVKPTTQSARPTQAPKTTAAPTTASVDCAGQADKNAPCTIQVGHAFQLGKHEVLTGWKVRKDVLGDVELVGKAKNIGDESSAMAIEVKFLRGSEVVMDVNCSTDSLEPEQTQAISCFSSDDYTTKYDKITAEAMF